MSGQPVPAALSSCGCSFVLFLPWDPFIFPSLDTSTLLAVRMAVYFCFLRECRGYHRTEVVGFDSLPKTLVGLGGHFCLTFTFSQILIFRQLFFSPVNVWLWYLFCYFLAFRSLLKTLCSWGKGNNSETPLSPGEGQAYKLGTRAGGRAGAQRVRPRGPGAQSVSPPEVYPEQQECPLPP